MFKKKRYQLLLLLLLLGITIVLFRTYLFCTFITYKSIGQHASYVATDKALINCIEKEIVNGKKMTIPQIIALSLELTAKELTFTGGKNHNDPNTLIHTKNAHCVGYAAFLATTCNYLLKKSQIANEWIAKPHIGQLYFLGVNIHPYFNTPFFKDHDFVIVENLKTKERVAIDATVFDYGKIDKVSLLK